MLVFDARPETAARQRTPAPSPVVTRRVGRARNFNPRRLHGGLLRHAGLPGMDI